ncbi:MAG: hypothetical protein RJB01_1477 [Actinomycetota bacterium]
MNPQSPAPDPGDEKAAWDAIVADLSGEIDLGPEFRAETPKELHAPGEQASDEYDYIDAYFDEGYEPPEPPPFRAAPDAISRFAWAGVIGGPLLALGGYVLHFGDLIGGIGIAAAIAGFFVLVARRDKHVPPGEDHGDGAVV